MPNNKTRAQLEQEALAAFRRKQSEGMAQAKADEQRKAAAKAKKQKVAKSGGDNYYAKGVTTALGGIYDAVTGMFK
jgi:hypothetical protein